MLPPLAKVTVGVMGSGTDEFPELAEPLGRLLARLGVNLLTGGGRGVMTSVSRAFTSEQRDAGICIGVLPSAGLDNPTAPKPGYPNPFIELPIFTHLPLSGARGDDANSRNHINVLTPAAIVALPGGEGTASEVRLALRYGKPAVVFCPDESSVRAFPVEIPRRSSIGEIEEFLRNVF